MDQSVPPAEAASIAYQEAHINDNIGYQLVVPVAVFSVLALLSVIGRLWARSKQKGGYALDDYLIVAAMVFAAAHVITTCLLIRYGLGRHAITVSPADSIMYGKVSLAADLTYVPALCLAKLSVLALYRRIFNQPGTPRWFSIGTWVIAIYITLYGIGVILSILLECQPISSLWTADCAPKIATTIATGSLNILSDIAVFLLPQPIIWGMGLSTQKKLAVTGLLVVGLFATVISIFRIPLIVLNGVNNPYDVTFAETRPGIWTPLEILVIIICACLPAMKVLWVKVFPNGIGLNTLRSLVRRQSGGGSSTDLELARPGRDWSKLSADKTNPKAVDSTEVTVARRSGSEAELEDHQIKVDTTFSVDSAARLRG